MNIFKTHIHSHITRMYRLTFTLALSHVLTLMPVATTLSPEQPPYCILTCAREKALELTREQVDYFESLKAKCNNPVDGPTPSEPHVIDIPTLGILHVMALIELAQSSITNVLDTDMLKIRVLAQLPKEEQKARITARLHAFLKTANILKCNTALCQKVASLFFTFPSAHNLEEIKKRYLHLKPHLLEAYSYSHFPPDKTWQIHTKQPVLSLLWNEDDTKIACESSEETIKTYTVRGAKHTQTIDIQAVLRTQNIDDTSMTTFSWSKDNQDFIIGCDDGTMIVVDIKTKDCIQIMPSDESGQYADSGHMSAVSAFDWNARGTILASGGLDGHIKLWEKTRSGLYIHTSTIQFGDDDEDSCIQTILWEKSSPAIAALFAHDVVQVTNTDSQEVLLQYCPHPERDATCIAWSPDGTLIASGSTDNTIKIVETSTRKIIKVLTHDDRINAIAWSSKDPSILASATEHIVNIWHIPTGLRVHTFSDATDSITCLVWNNSGDKLAAGSKDTNIYLWRFLNNEQAAHKILYDDSLYNPDAIPYLPESDSMDESSESESEDAESESSPHDDDSEDHSEYSASQEEEQDNDSDESTSSEQESEQEDAQPIKRRRRS